MINFCLVDDLMRDGLVLDDMPAVFDSVISATMEILRDLGPLVAINALLLENDHILSRSP